MAAGLLQQQQQQQEQEQQHQQAGSPEGKQKDGLGGRGGVGNDNRAVVSAVEAAQEEESAETTVFPRELGWLPIRLFHLRRGPLLGPLLQNLDDPLCMRHLFLRGALDECLRMMTPEMLSLKVWE